ncbi:MAG: cytochrome b561 [Methylophagaceae bacterium]|jgi:cytochrome b561
MMERQLNHNIRLGLATIFLHWIIAAAVIILFVSGIWMVSLDYYDPWYYQGPWWHKGIGILLSAFVLVQGVWQCIRKPVIALLDVKGWQARLSSLMHFALLLLIYVLVFSGYFIVTGQGQGLIFFDYFAVPSLLDLDDIVMRWMGDFHCYGAYLLMILVGLHFIAALKHHFVDQDAVLKRMLGK